MLLHNEDSSGKNITIYRFSVKKYTENSASIVQAI